MIPSRGNERRRQRRLRQPFFVGGNRGMGPRPQAPNQALQLKGRTRRGRTRGSSPVQIVGFVVIVEVAERWPVSVPPPALMVLSKLSWKVSPAGVKHDRGLFACTPVSAG
jgi:hypothetical protein